MSDKDDKDIYLEILEVVTDIRKEVDEIKTRVEAVERDQFAQSPAGKGIAKGFSG